MSLTMSLTMNLTMNLNCPSCNTVATTGDRFCEECGTPLMIEQTSVESNAQSGAQSGAQPSVQSSCQKCGSFDIDSEGFCNQCGHRNPAARDHQEVIVSADFAAISDRGIRHSRNEDAVAIDRLDNGIHVLVVCDGVSSSTDPGSASSLAAQTACQSIIQDLTQGIAPDVALKTAIANASTAVTNLGLQLGLKQEPPSTTIVAAIVIPPHLCDETRTSAQVSTNTGTSWNSTAIHVAWVGDSRAYWLSDAESLTLTQDHSWMNEVVAAGEMTEAEAEASPHAHAITRWLGADAHDNPEYRHDEPSFAYYQVTKPGRLMVCSDGLWNYAPQPVALHDLVSQSTISQSTIKHETIAILQHCLIFALQCGGQDNITIAVLNIPDK
jgi:PPM family protein phosphatase